MLSNARIVATLGASKVNDSAGLLLHKRKDGGAQEPYYYIIHGWLCEMGFCALRNVSLKKHVDWQQGGVLFYMKVMTPLKNERNKSVKQCATSII